jgi:Transposase DDE domain
LFARFDALLKAKGWLAMGGQIIDATVIEAPRPRLTQAEKDTIKGGGTPAEWTPARRAQIDRDGRWTIKRGRKREVPPGDGHKRQIEIAVPVFGYKNHVGIDREHGFLRRYSVTHAAAHDGGQLGAVLDRDNTASDVWADTAYHSAANLALLERRGLRPQFQRKKPRGKKMPGHIVRGNATRARVRSRVEHVFAAQKCRLGLVIRTVGMVRASEDRSGQSSLQLHPAGLAQYANRAGITAPPLNAKLRASQAACCTGHRPKKHRRPAPCQPQIPPQTRLFEASGSRVFPENTASRALLKGARFRGNRNSSAAWTIRWPLA